MGNFLNIKPIESEKKLNMQPFILSNDSYMDSYDFESHKKLVSLGYFYNKLGQLRSIKDGIFLTPSLCK